jgi:wyosine [tRNA(Phe)-imidazoG37] synthetase (radical SAM superfamily)
MKKLNTIDIDFKCRYLKKIQTKLSSSKKGVHITLWCSRNCEFCRLIYDDLNRYAKDKNRPEYGKNVLFTKKMFLSIQELLKPEKVRK